MLKILTEFSAFDNVEVEIRTSQVSIYREPGVLVRLRIPSGPPTIYFQHPFFRMEPYLWNLGWSPR